MDSTHLNSFIDSLGCEVTQMPLRGVPLRVLPCGDTLSETGLQQLLSDAARSSEPVITCPVCMVALAIKKSSASPRNICLEQVLLALERQLDD